MAGQFPQTGPKFTPLEREEAIAEVARLYRRGVNQYDIGRKLGISQPQVSNYVKVIRERYRESAGEDYGALVKARIDQLYEIMVEAWEEWERSKHGVTKVVQEHGRVIKPGKDKDKPGKKKGKATNTTDPDPQVRADQLALIRETVTKEGRLGDPRYLTVIRECLKDISQLEGLIDGRGSDTPAGGFDWEKFLSAPREPTVEERADETVRKAIAARGENGTADGPVIDGTLADGERQQQEVG
jgi:predicted transcriptional regulator